MPVKTLSVPVTSSTAGAAVGVMAASPEKSFHFSGVSSGTFSLATLQIQGSNDNSNWAQLGSDITTNGIVAIDCITQFVRIYTSTYISGTPVCVMAYHEPARS